MTLRLIQSIDYRLARLEELADWLANEVDLEPEMLLSESLLADGEAWLEELREVIDGLKLEKQQYS